MSGQRRRSSEASLLEKLNSLEDQFSKLLEENRAAEERRKQQIRFLFALLVTALALDLMTAFDITNAILNNWTSLEPRFWIAGTLISIFIFMLKVAAWIWK